MSTVPGMDEYLEREIRSWLWDAEQKRIKRLVGRYNQLREEFRYNFQRRSDPRRARTLPQIQREGRQVRHELFFAVERARSHINTIISSLANLKGYTRLWVEGECLHARTDRVRITYGKVEYDFGNYVVSLRPNQDGSGMGFSLSNPKCPEDHFLHPHYKNDGFYCFDSFEDVLETALHDNDVPSFLTTFRDFLGKYNSDSPLCQIEYFSWAGGGYSLSGEGVR